MKKIKDFWEKLSLRKRITLFIILSVAILGYFYTFFHRFLWHCQSLEMCYSCSWYGCVDVKYLALIYSIFGLIVLYTLFFIYTKLRSRKDIKSSEKKEELNWKEFLKKSWLLVAIIGLVLFEILFIYMSVPFFTFSDSLQALAEIPDGEIEYEGIIEYSSYIKDVMPEPVICGDCFGIGKPYENEMKNGECCYDLHPYSGEFYQVAKIIATFPKEAIAHSPIRELRFSVKDVIILKDLTPKDCENRNYKPYCYEYFAKKLNDLNLCNKIENEEYREVCKRRVDAD